jgi:hypothetical protein
MLLSDERSLLKTDLEQITGFTLWWAGVSMVRWAVLQYVSSNLTQGYTVVSPPARERVVLLPQYANLAALHQAAGRWEVSPQSSSVSIDTGKCVLMCLLA